MSCQKHMPQVLCGRLIPLRSVIHTEHNINIHNYPRLIQYLKNNSKVLIFNSKKAEVLDPANIYKFIKETPDNEYLAVKVSTISFKIVI